MPVAVDLGLLVLYVCLGSAMVILAHTALVRVAQLGREYQSDHVIAERHLRLQERQCDLRRSLDQRDRELAMEEAEHCEDEDEEF
jgi:hypothetical protein